MNSITQNDLSLTSGNSALERPAFTIGKRLFLAILIAAFSPACSSCQLLQARPASRSSDGSGRAKAVELRRHTETPSVGLAFSEPSSLWISPLPEARRDNLTSLDSDCGLLASPPMFPVSSGISLLQCCSTRTPVISVSDKGPSAGARGTPSPAFSSLTVTPAESSSIRRLFREPCWRLPLRISIIPGKTGASVSR
jgi:hypothetical protein